MIDSRKFLKLSFIGGVVVLFLFFAVQIFSQTVDNNSYPDPENYAPNLWFDSDEKYYPIDPLRFYYNNDLSELSGEAAVDKYDRLSLEERLLNFTVFYSINDSGDELVYQYWLFYVFNDADNKHYGDWEFVQVFVNKQDNNVSKVLASAHTGTTTKVFFTHGELLNPQFDHSTILVEKGSHANWIDGNNNGTVEWKKDITNWYNAYKIRRWSSEDQQNGVKIFHDSPYYDLRPLSEIKEKIGNSPLISKEKSPILGMVPLQLPFKITSSKLGINDGKFYALKLGGAPPQNAWLKPEYHDPEKASPVTIAKVIGKIRGIGEGVFAKIQNAFAGIGRIMANLFTTIFSFGQNSTSEDQEGSPGQSVVLDEAPEEDTILEEAASEELLYDAELTGQSPNPEAHVGDVVTLAAEFQNTGSALWERQNVSLNSTTKPPSPFYHLSWLTQRRPALFDQAQVIPGETGAFTFSIQVPETVQGETSFELRPVYQDASGFHWLGDDSVSWVITIVKEEEGIDAVGTQSGITQEIHIPEGGEGLEIVEKIDEPQKDREESQNQEDPQEKSSPLPQYYFSGGGSSVSETSGYGNEEEDDGEEEQGQEEEPPPSEEESSQSKIIINEIQINRDEFVELYNPSDQEVDMTGWYFSYFSQNRIWNEPHRNKLFPEFPDRAIIPALGHYLIGLAGYPELNGNPDADWQVYSSTQLGNSNGAVAIFPWNPKTKSAEEVELGRIDAVGWGEPAVREGDAAEVPGENQSIARHNSLIDTDNNLNDFSIQSNPTPTNSSGETREKVDTHAPIPFIRLSDEYSPVSLNFTIEWGLESSEEESQLDVFELEFSDDGEVSWDVVQLTEEEDESHTKTFAAPEDEKTYYVRVRTIDILGNKSDWEELAIDVNTRAVVINEIGYRGTDAFYFDEWIELFNVSPRDISLEGWTLIIGKDQTYKVKLSGVIPAGGYYMLESDITSPDSDSVISDIPANLLYQDQGVINDGQILMWLTAPDGTLVDRVDKIWSSHPDERTSMERVSPYVAGYDRYNWLLNNTETTNGHDAEGNPILGTPKSENSVYLLYHSLFLVPSISSDTTFFKERSPYVVYDIFTVEEGAILTVEPGVIFHFAKNRSRLIIEGTLLSLGTAEEEIIYTSIRDGEYNGTGGAAPGAWKWIVFTSKSSGSIFEYSRIRYPGNFPTGRRGDNGGIIVSGTDLIFRNSVFEHALIKGFQVFSARVTIENSKFLHNNSSYDTTGLIIEGESDVTIADSEFRDNTFGINIRTANEVPIASSVFTENGEPIRAFDGGYPLFSGENIFLDNNYNGPLISGEITQDTTWASGVTYIVYYGLEVVEGVTLTIEPGTIIKFARGKSFLDVYGTISAHGTEDDPIAFTSLRDDEYGGDATSDGESSGAPGNWKWIRVFGGENSVFEHVVIRYAGSYRTGFRGTNAALWIAGADVGIRNMVLEHALIYGLRLSGCDCVVEDSVFQYNNTVHDSVAIEIHGSPTMRNIQIIDNSVGIWVKGESDPTFENISFKGNTKDTIPEDLMV